MNMTEPPSLKLNMLHQNQAAQHESQFFKLLWFHSQSSYKKLNWFIDSTSIYILFMKLETWLAHGIYHHILTIF